MYRFYTRKTYDDTITNIIPPHALFENMSNKLPKLFFLGRPFSPLYSSIMKFRELLYVKGLRKRYTANVPVISVGNLTMGGTGKTPVVSLLATLLLKKGLKPAIISRGYGGSAKQQINIVSDGKNVFLDAQAAGDEPCFLAKTLPEVLVLTGTARALPCHYAVKNMGATVLILDDGFQHLSVQRNLDLVLFSAATLAGNSRVFPGGDLREPVSALKRCHAFMITGVTDELKEQSSLFAKLLKQRFPDKPVFFAAYKAVGAVSLKDAHMKKLQDLPQPLFAFCGIAQPELFHKTITQQNIDLTGFIPLDDHQAYPPSLIETISNKALLKQSKGLICTEKDAVKFQKNSFALPCFALKMTVEPDPDFLIFFKNHIQSLLADDHLEHTTSQSNTC